MTDPVRSPPMPAIMPELVSEIAYRVHLARLEPPMTPEKSETSLYVSKDSRTGRDIVQDDASRRRAAKSYEPLTRTFLRVMSDMGMVTL